MLKHQLKITTILIFYLKAPHNKYQKKLKNNKLILQMKYYSINNLIQDSGIKLGSYYK